MNLWPWICTVTLALDSLLTNRAVSICLIVKVLMLKYVSLLW